MRADGECAAGAASKGAKRGTETGNRRGGLKTETLGKPALEQGVAAAETFGQVGFLVRGPLSMGGVCVDNRCKP